MKKLFLALITLAGLALAADLGGQWSGSFEITAPDGSTQQATAFLVFKVAGDTVTGTAGPTQEQQNPIQNVVFDGKHLSFDIGGDGHPAIKFDLVYDGDTIKGTASGQQGDQKMSAKLDVKRKQ